MKPRSRRLLFVVALTVAALALSHRPWINQVRYWSREVCDITGSERMPTQYRDGGSATTLDLSPLEKEAHRRGIHAQHDWHRVEYRSTGADGRTWHGLAAHLTVAPVISAERAAAMSDDELRRMVHAKPHPAAHDSQALVSDAE